MKTIRVITILSVLTAVLFTTPVEAQKRRGWSPQAKGTAIGTGIGAAAGAIINKRNRVVGGVIGAAAGAAGGYAVGKGIDNKRKTNARIAAAEREAANARQEAALARQEAANAANKPAVGTRPTAERMAAVKRTTAPTVAATSTSLRFSSNTLAEPYVNKTLFLSNDTYGDQSSAYPTSEVRRKSW
ncbi:MAG: glycine zipper 2TM domain-containing protein [Spirosoma sp.]|nr:glycine zipper 2TM domain-containing protein [Spirosoma sp.]